MPPDSYDLYFSPLATAERDTVSNTVPFEIEDSFLDWRWGAFFQNDVFDPSVSGPAADVDLDDLSTLAEYVHFRRSYGTLNALYRVYANLTPRLLLDSGKKYLTDNWLTLEIVPAR